MPQNVSESFSKEYQFQLFENITFLRTWLNGKPRWNRYNVFLFCFCFICSFFLSTLAGCFCNLETVQLFILVSGHMLSFSVSDSLYWVFYTEWMKHVIFFHFLNRYNIKKREIRKISGCASAKHRCLQQKFIFFSCQLNDL